MKKSLKSLCLLSAISAGSVHALFSNGGFENVAEGFTNWNLKYGTHSATLINQGFRGSAAVDWDNPQADQPPAIIVTPTTDPTQDGINGAFYDPYVPLFNTPYEGTHKAQLNYHNWGTLTDPVPGGNYHATQISQVGTVTTQDAYEGKYNLYVSWGAVMNDPNHADGENPFFEIIIKVNNIPVVNELHYSNETTALNWYRTPNSPTYTPNYFTASTFSYEGLKVGDQVEVVLSVADCSLSGHGVSAWIDYAGTTPPPLVIDTTDTTATPVECLTARDALRLGDNSTVDGDILSGGYGEIGAYATVGGNVSFKGISFLRSFSSIQGNFTYETTESYQEGTVVGTSVQGPVAAPTLNTRVLTVGSGWNEIRNGEDATLTPGSYGDLTVRANAILHLSAGVYTFTNLNIESNATVIITNANAATTIEVAYNMDIYSGAVLQVEDASKLTWYTNDNRVELHSGLNMVGAIFAPAGQVVLQPRSTLLGSIKAVDILVEANTSVTCKISTADTTIATSSSSAADTTITTSSSSAATGVFVCTDSCLNAEAVTYSANLNTTNDKWFVTAGPIQGWQVSQAEDRVITVNGIEVAPGTVPLTAAADGMYYFHFSAGSKAWASWSLWR